MSSFNGIHFSRQRLDNNATLFPEPQIQIVFHQRNPQARERKKSLSIQLAYIERDSFTVCQILYAGQNKGMQCLTNRDAIQKQFREDCFANMHSNRMPDIIVLTRAKIMKTLKADHKQYVYGNLCDLVERYERMFLFIFSIK